MPPVFFDGPFFLLYIFVYKNSFIYNKQIHMKVVIIMGSPGAGKGTQAELVARTFGFFHFDTGRVLERMFYFDHQEWPDKKEFAHEKEFFTTGKLNTPSFVLAMITKKIERFARNEENLVFSGSPRTAYEAFDGDDRDGMIQVLERLYGKDNIMPFVLEIPEEESIRRNSGRVLCSVCGLPVLSIKGVEASVCPFCGGKLRKRVLDNPETMKVRLEEYERRTKPVVDGLSERGYMIHHIDGTKLPYEVFESIASIINDSLKNGK
jgi:adenylate kinase